MMNDVLDKVKAYEDTGVKTGRKNRKWPEEDKDPDVYVDPDRHINMNDYTASFEANTLREYLPVMASPKEIIDAHRRAKENPEILNAVRATNPGAKYSTNCSKC